MNLEKAAAFLTANDYPCCAETVRLLVHRGLIRALPRARPGKGSKFAIPEHELRRFLDAPYERPVEAPAALARKPPRLKVAVPRHRPSTATKAPVDYVEKLRERGL